jgi:HlyD family secretion protein
MTQALKPDYWPLPGLPPRPSDTPPPPGGALWRRWPWLVGGFALLVSLAAAISLSGRLAPPAAVPVAPVKRDAVTALGWLEPASDIVKLAAPATVEPSRIARLLVKEGALVEAGQVVAVLDTADKLQAQLIAGEAQVALKRALLERVRADTENSIVARRMAIARAKAEVEVGEAEFTRQQTLVGREIATPANLEKRKRDLAVARAQLEEAQSGLQRLEATLPAENHKPIQIDVAVAERELAAAQADLAQTRILLDQASIRSPIKGRIITVHSRPGEKMSQDGVVELGATHMVAIAEVYQSDIGLIRVGQAVELRSDTLNTPVTGVVERIGLRVKRQSVINNDPATATDARVIEVRVLLDAASSARAAGLSHLQVRAYFKLDGQ